MNKKGLPYDPDLKIAIEEIKAILDKFQISATVILNSPTHAEYLNYFPVWSAIQFEKSKPMIKIRSKRKDFNSREEQHAILEASVGLIARARDISAQNFTMYHEIFKIMEKHMDIVHKSFSGHMPHFEN